MDEAKRKRLANPRPFKPGQSGNPGGRSKAQIDVRNAAREYTLAGCGKKPRMWQDIGVQ
jgi:hypothetical protein